MIKEGFVWAIMLLPLASFALITLVSFLGSRGRRTGDPLSGTCGTAATSRSWRSSASFLLSIWAFAKVADTDGTRVGYEAHDWLNIGTLNIIDRHHAWTD